MIKNSNKAVLLMSLGSPDSVEVKDVRRYLNEFLMDERVIDYPWLFRKILVGGIIVPFRASKSAAAYKSIWTKEGSPLVQETKELKEVLQQEMQEPVEIAMRYGNPRPADAFDRLLMSRPVLNEVLAIPLYPHYAMSSYETGLEYAKKIHRENNYSFELSFLKPFYNNPDYINAMVENIRPYLAQDYDHILFSYHGVPQRHIRKSDPTGSHCLASADCCEVDSTAHAYCYRHQCFTTTGLITSLLKIPPEKFSNSFQSRLGKGWLQPFTDYRLEQLPQEGKKRLLILCPSFVSDCLETLEEIGERGRESFMHAGGESFTLVPCLNNHPAWVGALAKWIKNWAGGSTEMINR